jgi:hypothetical protein
MYMWLDKDGTNTHHSHIRERKFLQYQRREVPTVCLLSPVKYDVQSKYILIFIHVVGLS